MRGKATCKAALQSRMHLIQNPDVPVFGVVSRFADQKGLDMLAGAIENCVRDMLIQFVILGSGDRDLEFYFGRLPQLYPGLVGSFIGYNNELSHWIEAGSDFFGDALPL